MLKRGDSCDSLPWRLALRAMEHNFDNALRFRNCLWFCCRLLDIATKDADILVKEIAVWALRILVQNHTCRKVSNVLCKSTLFTVLIKFPFLRMASLIPGDPKARNLCKIVRNYTLRDAGRHLKKH